MECEPEYELDHNGNIITIPYEGFTFKVTEGEPVHHGDPAKLEGLPTDPSGYTTDPESLDNTVERDDEVAG